MTRLLEHKTRIFGMSRGMGRLPLFLLVAIVGCGNDDPGDSAGTGGHTAGTGGSTDSAGVPNGSGGSPASGGRSSSDGGMTTTNGEGTGLATGGRAPGSGGATIGSGGFTAGSGTGGLGMGGVVPIGGSGAGGARSEQTAGAEAEVNPPGLAESHPRFTNPSRSASRTLRRTATKTECRTAATRPQTSRISARSRMVMCEATSMSSATTPSPRSQILQQLIAMPARGQWWRFCLRQEALRGPALRGRLLARWLEESTETPMRPRGSSTTIPI